MKKVILLICMCLLVSGMAIARDFEAKKFKTTFTVVFNAMTLEESARMETVIKKKFSDACSIDVELEKIDDITIGSTGTGTVWWDEEEASR